ncbi:heavy metal-binding domain-containing protein [Geomonas subterranea]|uniref:heavy metal-binding domain-containing protein n=1 Tax=Geomonas subterranea TaxID=2847989 RepID=UPI001CD398E2|nr:heavy metal-binding domain-containing protein [Geomonas fuzhouensis]
MPETSVSLYRSAYETHYKVKNFDEAAQAYRQLIELFPDSEEAGYARTQLENIEQFGAPKAVWEEYQHEEPEPKPQRPLYPVTLTTAPTLEGYRVIETVEIVTAECALGLGLISDLFTAVTDIVGGNSGSLQKALRHARQTCLEELKREAYEVGANAVIAVDLDYSEFSGQGKSMVFLVASGTAVKVEKMCASETATLPNS